MTTLTDTQVVTASGGLVELGYSQRTTDVAIPVSAAASPTTVISDLTVVCDGSPVLVEFFSPLARPGTTAGNILGVALYQDGTEIDRYFAYVETPASGWMWAPLNLRRRLTPTAGSHTFSIRAFSIGNAGSINAGSGGTSWSPAFLRVSKIVQATQWPAVTTGTIICTSTTRPASPFEGQTIYETDTDLEQRWTGSAWSQIWPQLFVTASDTTTQTGAFGSDFVYATATITLTPGVWLVQGSAVLFNTVTSDGACVGLYNVTTAAEVTNSRGPNGTVTTGQSLQLTSRLVQMSVSASTNVRVLCTRNGSSTIRCGSASGAPAAALWAQKVG